MRSNSYRLRTSNGRTSNGSQQECVKQLEADGWAVLKNGWPDFVATKGGEVRFIKVRPSECELSPRQRRMVNALRLAGIEVEIYAPRAH
jgi:hypothetical protein